jgi:hypothetical protein
MVQIDSPRPLLPQTNSAFPERLRAGSRSKKMKFAFWAGLPRAYTTCTIKGIAHAGPTRVRRLCLPFLSDIPYSASSRC